MYIINSIYLKNSFKSTVSGKPHGEGLCVNGVYAYACEYLSGGRGFKSHWSRYVPPRRICFFNGFGLNKGMVFTRLS